jgi:NAD(P)-dependent dehydrogenase (short-subunit alcohol dehydrogenase family)
MRGLSGKVVVVCAGGTGDGTKLGASIGGFTARRLAAEGAAVVVGDLSEEDAHRTAELIVADGGAAVARFYDARNEGETKALMDLAVDTYGGIDGVHFNANDSSLATVEADGEHDLLTLPLEAWNGRMETCLLGFVFAARYAIPHLLERGAGGIVGTTSDAAYLGEPVRVAYAAAKAGMGAVVRHIASRWGREGVRANAVAPGVVPSAAMLADDRMKGVLTMPRSTRLGKPDDIAAMVTFLLSEDGAWVNGQSIGVDGGLFMRP